MRAPHFLRLAEIDERRFINACRHGLIHLTWDRVTVRLTRDEFRRLTRLLARSADTQSPRLLRDGGMQVAWASGEDCELRLGSLKLALSPDDFHALGQAVQEGAEQLDRILDAGMWDEAEPREAPPTIVEHFRQHRFSEN